MKTKFISKDGKTAFWLLLIPLGWWLVIGLFPVIWGMGLSFTEWTNLADGPKFNFFDNYVTFFTTERYIMSMLRSFLLGGGSFVLTNLCGFFIAYMLNKITVGKTLLRTIWYIPAVTSAVATTQIFEILLDPFNGVLNNMIMKSGGEPIIWMQSTFWAVAWILIYSLWKGIGGSVLLWLAGLQSMDEKLEEAAQLDGANSFQIFWYVKLPQLKSISAFIMVTGMAGAMQIYEQVYFISDGGPYGTTEVLAYQVMKEAFWNSNFGMACTCAVMMMIVTLILSIPSFRSMMKKDD